MPKQGAEALATLYVQRIDQTFELKYSTYKQQRGCMSTCFKAARAIEQSILFFFRTNQASAPASCVRRPR